VIAWLFVILGDSEGSGQEWTYTINLVMAFPAVPRCFTSFNMTNGDGVLYRMQSHRLRVSSRQAVDFAGIVRALWSRMTSDKGKTPSESAVETRYLVMPQQANPQGTAFGGAIVSWIDMVAAMAGQRHCGREVVTAQIDTLVFRHPIHIGDQVVLRAAVNYVGRSSREVGVQVIRENPYTGEEIVATTAHLTLVALDQEQKPTAVPPLLPQTPEEERRYEAAKLRVQARKERLRTLQDDKDV
jgi:acyl-CoA hydrolase